MKIFIQPCGNRWGIRQEGEAEAVGNYISPAEAARIARHNFAEDVEIVMPPAQPAGVPVLPTRSPAARLGEICAELGSAPAFTPFTGQPDGAAVRATAQTGAARPVAISGASRLPVSGT